MKRYSSIYEKVSDINYLNGILSFNTDKVLVLFKKYTYQNFKLNPDVDRDLINIIFPDSTNFNLRSGHQAGEKSFYIYYELSSSLKVTIKLDDIFANLSDTHRYYFEKYFTSFKNNPDSKSELLNILNFIFNNSLQQYSQFVMCDIDFFNSNFISKLDSISKNKKIIDPRASNISKESTPDYVLDFVKKYINTMGYIKNTSSQKKTDVDKIKGDILTNIPKVYDWYQSLDNKIQSNITVYRGLDFYGLDKTHPDFNNNKLKAVKSIFKIKKLEDLFNLKIGKTITYSHRDYTLPISCSMSRKVSTAYSPKLRTDLRDKYILNPDKPINGISLLIKCVVRPEDILIDTNLVETAHPFQNEIILSPYTDYDFKIVDIKLYNEFNTK
jgi:hypothetical protein